MTYSLVFVREGKALDGLLSGAPVDSRQPPLLHHPHVVLQPVHVSGQRGERHELRGQNWREHYLRPGALYSLKQTNLSCSQKYLFSTHPKIIKAGIIIIKISNKCIFYAMLKHIHHAPI